jgi:hypothetical protein
MKSRNPLDNIRIATPCPVGWEQMEGDARVRLCESCNLHVYNIAEMSRTDAKVLFANTEGRICARLFRRADGTIITRDCPVGLRAIRRRVAKTATAVFATIAGICATVFPQRNNALRTNPASTTAGSSSLNSNFVTLSASLSGEVTDPMGEPISGATLTLTNLKTRHGLVVKSNTKGRYHFLVSEFGLYRLKVESPYFSTFTEELELHLNDDMRRDVSLDVGIIGVVIIEPVRKSGFDLSGVHIRIN